LSDEKPTYIEISLNNPEKDNFVEWVKQNYTILKIEEKNGVVRIEVKT